MSPALQIPTLSYPAPFQYGAMTTNKEEYKIHQYIDEQKLLLFKSPFDGPYPKIDIDLKYFKILCEDTDDINRGDVNGQTILHALCLYGSANAIKIALEAGADILAEDLSGFSVAHYCAMADRDDLLGFVDRNGADITHQALSSSRTPLHVAALCRSVRSVGYLISTGVNINQVDNFGCSALWLAMYYKSNEVCQVLAEHGAIASLNEIDKVTFTFRTFDYCPEFGKSLLDMSISQCKYREAAALRLKTLVDGVSYEMCDLTHSYITIRGIPEDFVSHPLIGAYIDVAWSLFGRKEAILETGKSFVFCLLWTLHFMLDTGKSFQHGKNVPKIIIYCLILPYLFFRIYELAVKTSKIAKSRRRYQQFELETLQRESDNLHPCMWNAIHTLLRSEKATRSIKLSSVIREQYFKVIIYLLTFTTLILDLMVTDTGGPQDGRPVDAAHLPQINYAHNVVSSTVLLALWVSTFNILRYFKEFGTFITSIRMLGSLITKYAIMYIFFYIPMASIFWKTLYEPFDEQTKSRNYTLPQVLYQVYRMSYSDYTYSEGFTIASALGIPTWWNVLTFAWITLSSLVLLRIFGGLVFAILAQPIRESLVIAKTERLLYICEMVMCMRRDNRQNFMRYLEVSCNPYVTDKYYVDGGGAESGGPAQGENVAQLRLQVKQLRAQLSRLQDVALLEQSTSSDMLIN